MADEQVQKLLQGALKAAREGNADQARKAFLYVLKMQPQNEVAWMGLATVAQDQREQVIALQKAVEINPQNARAKAALERILGASAAPTPPPAPPPVERARPPQSTFIPTPPPPVEDSYEEEAYEEEAYEEVYEEEAAEDEFEAALEDETSADDDFEAALEDDTSADDEFEAALRDEVSAPVTQPSDAPPTVPAPPVTAPAPTSPVLPETPLFSQLALTPPGEEGVPVPKRRALEATTQQGEAMINAFIRQEMEDRLIEWQRKPRGRAGENELRNRRIRIALGVGIPLIFAVVLGAGLYFSSPEYQKLVFAPTWTVSPTFTPTPSNTPGATLTASPTPLESSTPTPTLDPSVTPGRPEDIYRPESTRIYFPPGVQRAKGIEEADALINEGKIDEATTLLEKEKQATLLIGDFMPYYYLARIQYDQGNYEAAQSIVTEGRVNWEDKTAETSYEPMIRVSEGRLQYINLKQQLDSGTPLRNLQDEFDDLITSVQNAAELGGEYDEPYLLLADIYRAMGDYPSALGVINDAQTGIHRKALFANTRLRFKKAEIYRDQGLLDQALFELDDLLRLNPFEEVALRMRMDIAVQKNNPGLVVLYAQDYQYYYPESSEGYRLMGDAFVKEDKIGLAMVQYTRALQGDPTTPAYANALASRAAVYASQERYDLALADLSQALEIQPQNMDIRWQHYQASLNSDEYALAAEDLTALQEAGAITPAQFTILNTQILIDQATLDASGQQEALSALQRLRDNDIPDDLRPLTNELLARLQFALGRPADALNALDDALAQEDTASRRVLRGQILQAQAGAATRDETRLDLYLSAQREFDFVLSWSVIYRYPFIDDVETRYAAVTSEIARLRTLLAEEDS